MRTAFAVCLSLFALSACTIEYPGRPPQSAAPAPVVYESQPPPPPAPPPGYVQEQPMMPVKSTGYFWDENRSALGSHRCRSEFECDGLRICTENGWCEGQARPQNVVYAQPQKGPRYGWNEERNALGAHRCRSEWECDGQRVCSANGWCEGEARPFGPPRAVGVSTVTQDEALRQQQREQMEQREIREREHQQEQQREIQARDMRAREVREQELRERQLREPQHEVRTLAPAGKAPSYRHDEGRSHGRCGSDAECDGMRTCQRGVCMGRPR